MAENGLKMEQRPFAHTGKNVSVLGLGTVKFGRNANVRYPGGEGFALPSDREIEEILDLCLEHGVNYLDTAPAYGTSEEILGRLLGARADKFFISTKTGEIFDGKTSTHDFTAGHTRRTVEESLRRLKRERLDCVLIHCSRNDVPDLAETDVIETLARLKDEGKIASFGASTYSLEGGLIAVEKTEAVMVNYNPGYLDELPVIEAAHKKGKTVLVKKGLASGYIDKVGGSGASIRFCVKTPGVTSLVVGSINKDNILSNINALLNP
jgi:aryl-alcohol dehydrogenase-like predicted oxidoreductase